MAKKIDWLYKRKSCVTCQRADGYIETAGTKVGEVVDARKDRIDPAGALKLAKTVDKIVAAKGKKVVTLDLKKDHPGDETVLAHLIGPTGNLRAPTARVGRTLLVGFDEASYAEVLGS